jgi:hypothetical protein
MIRLQPGPLPLGAGEEALRHRRDSLSRVERGRAEVEALLARDQRPRN